MTEPTPHAAWRAQHQTDAAKNNPQPAAEAPAEVQVTVPVTENVPAPAKTAAPAKKATPKR